ncbi:hypothetical protein J0X19_03220 [Hymenobacter sp. BT186]|uniref:T9SS type A sorting domain-containing protein n=1 Tax=Hymenobacter telluris TaxID=2816474 RepID=A0A939EUJ2_9BACT|nr:hypothetical protein [Hymenobacter telluris]MBO0356945.1 hypothetical protein [Hymenobacter telluris]MBW3372972.1 hypothetical protein [Hymenobacter norwichensis]
MRRGKLSVASNPPEGTTKLTFGLQKAGAATGRGLDITGRTVATVRNAQKLAAGAHTIERPALWQAGLYVVSVATGKSAQAVRFVVTQ